METSSGLAVNIISKTDDRWKVDEEALKKIFCFEEIKDKKVKI